MAATPETLRPEVPQVQERAEEFVVPETLQQSTGVKVVQKNFKSQVKDDTGNPIVQTPPTQIVTTIQPPANTQKLTQQSKGNIVDSATWFASFWLRIIKKAIHFGWKIVGNVPTETSN